MAKQHTKKYNVDLTGAAHRDLKRIKNKKLLDAIDKAIQSFEDNPRPLGCEKLSNRDEYRYRKGIGSYRIIYEINDDACDVLVTRIRHRREVYKKKR